MDTAKLNDWIQIAAAMGVIAGLVLVAYEIRVSNRLGLEEANAAAFDTLNTITELAVSTDAGDLFVRAYECDQLTRIEMAKLDEFINAFVRALSYDYLLAQTGTLALEGGFESYYHP